MQPTAITAIGQEHLHLLPLHIQEIANLIGLPATLALIDTYGGTSFSVPHHKKDGKLQGSEQFNALSKQIGSEKARIITEQYGAARIYIPKCRDTLRRIRNIMMIKEYDSQRATGKTATSIIYHLAVKHSVSERIIWTIVNKHTEAELLHIKKPRQYPKALRWLNKSKKLSAQVPCSM